MLKEDSPLKGAILSGDCGIGKTVIMLLLVYVRWKQGLEEWMQGTTRKYLPTLILAPSALTSVWYKDAKKFFGGILQCKLFLSKGHIYDQEREEDSIGTTVEDLDRFLEDLDIDDPEVSSISNGQVNYVSTNILLSRPPQLLSFRLFRYFQIAFIVITKFYCRTKIVLSG